jgi:hypothetical protein
MSVCSSVWWCYCGCQYYSVMDKTWQTAEWLHLQCSDVWHHHCTDKLIHGNCCITTDELWSILFMDKGSVMAITEEPGCSKVYSLGDMIADRCTQRQGQQLLLIFAPIWQWSLGLPVADCHGGQKLGPTLWTWTKMQLIEWCHMTSPKKKFKCVTYAGKKRQSFGMRCYSCELIAQRINSDLQPVYWNTRKSEWLLLPSSSHEKDVGSVAAARQC